MSAADLREMILTVADRFSFRSFEIWNMSISELWFWYDGAIDLYKADKEAVDGKAKN